MMSIKMKMLKDWITTNRWRIISLEVLSHESQSINPSTIEAARYNYSPAPATFEVGSSPATMEVRFNDSLAFVYFVVANCFVLVYALIVICLPLDSLLCGKLFWPWIWCSLRCTFHQFWQPWQFF